MKRLLVFSACLAIVCAANPASADVRAQWDAFWARFEKDYHRNNCWPTPFQEADRQATEAPFAIMTQNGWRTYNTVAHQFFNEKNELTKAGISQVKWIVNQAPVERRQVFVLRGETPDDTNQRLESVHNAIVNFTGGRAPEAMVSVTDRVPNYGSGEYMDQVDRNFRQAIPSPILPARQQVGN